MKLRGFAAGNLGLHRGDLTAIGPSDQLGHMRVGDQRDIVLMMNRAHAIHIGVGLGVHHARIAVAGVAANALAVLHVLLVNVQTNRNRKWMVTKLGHAVEQFLNARLIADRRKWIFRFGRRLGRIRATLAVHVEKNFGLRVVRFEVFVTDWPSW